LNTFHYCGGQWIGRVEAGLYIFSLALRGMEAQTVELKVKLLEKETRSSWKKGVGWDVE
jgi:hypothetical protein